MDQIILKSCIIVRSCDLIIQFAGIGFVVTKSLLPFQVLGGPNLFSNASSLAKRMELLPLTVTSPSKHVLCFNRQLPSLKHRR